MKYLVVLVFFFGWIGCTPQKSSYNGPTCEQWRKAPKANKPYHPQLWHGVVSGLPDTSASSPSWLLSTAHAFAFKAEEPLHGVTVVVSAIDQQYKPTGAQIKTAITDEQGRWCTIVYPKPGEMMMVRTTSLHTELRVLAVHPFDLSINAQSEALVRWLIRHKIKPGDIKPAWFLNVRTLSDTAAGLLGRIKISASTTQAQLITSTLASFDRDARLTKKRQGQKMQKTLPGK